MSARTPVRVERDGAVTTVWLDAPPLNPINTDLREALAGVVADIAADPTVRAVVLAGGERAFAAGADITGLAAMSYPEILEWNARLQRVFTSVAELPQPVVAALRGYALGGGLELALCADYRIAAENAVVGLPEVQLGIMPGSGGTQRLTEIVGRSRAKELMMTGRRVDAGEALELGIVDEVLPAEEVHDRATGYARRLARGPRLAIRAIKQAVDEAAGATSTGLALERTLLAGLFATEDRARGMRSFLEHGPGHAEFE
ncbi:enoyl-CoA hydratase/isomerase family protein [Streptomyces mutabilis]|uniref:enoyl-CoA hydratase/isomerase family protein n=1 Tax=Streptomyces mutabilis TaxID=67332 RepID=UPI0033B43EA2